MNKEHISIAPVDIKNSQTYWERILAKAGMPPELPLTQLEIAENMDKLVEDDYGNLVPDSSIVEFTSEFENVRAMQDLTDDQVVQENLYGDPVLAKDGLPPCLRLKKDRQERGIKS